MSRRNIRLNLMSLVALLVITAAAHHVFSSESPVPRQLPPLPHSGLDLVSYKNVLTASESKCDDRQCRWWHDYVLSNVLASTDGAESCQLLNALADEKKFPLRLLVHIRQSERCATTQEQLEKIYETLKKDVDGESPPSWLRLELLRAELHAALAIKSSASVDLALQTARMSMSRAARIQILQGAIIALEKEKNPRLGEIQDELYRVSPRFKPVPDDWWAVAQDALSAHDYELAAKALEKVTRAKGTPVATRRMAFESLKNSYKALQKRGDAFKVTQRRWKWDKALFDLKRTANDAAKNLLVSALALAKFQWTEHHASTAERFLVGTEKLLNKKVPLGELYFVRGRIDEEHGKNERALNWIKRAADQAADVTQKTSYLWSLAWLNFKMKRFEVAKSIWETTIKTETDPGRKAQQMFWLAQTLKALNKPEDAKALWQQVINDDPLSYYAVMSSRQLQKPIAAPAGAPPLRENLKRIPASSPVSTENLFDWLVTTGELKWARELLDDEAPLPDTLLAADRKVLGQYARSGYFGPVFSRVNKLTPSEQQAFLASDPQFVFPRLYSDFVNQASQQSGLWPEYIFAIMRQESSFDSTVVSPANAYGLLQLLPTIADQLAKELKVPYSNPEDLLDPKLNIELGAHHLRKYWDEFDGQFILATAAYNASPQAVKSWVKTRFRGDPLMFIEDIPYDETRTYVKLVLRNFVHYLRMTSPTSSIAFPEWCLEGIQAPKE